MRDRLLNAAETVVFGTLKLYCLLPLFVMEWLGYGDDTTDPEG